MNHPDFAKDFTRIEFLYDIIKRLPDRMIDPTLFKMLLQEEYEKRVGIRNHDIPDPGEYSNGIDLALMNDSESVVHGCGYVKRIQQFMNNNINGMLGISFSDWIKQPRHVVELQIEMCNKALAEKHRQSQQQIESLDRLRQENQ